MKMEDMKTTLDSIKSKWQAGGQSMVEFALLLPLLIMLLSGLVEFGFAVNMYLDLIDTAREVARYAADRDPVHIGDTFVPYNEDFYIAAIGLADYTFLQAGQITLDTDSDDVVISIIQVTGTDVHARYPLSGTGLPETGYIEDNTTAPHICTAGGATPVNGGEIGWRRYCNHISRFTSAEIESRLDAMDATLPPDTGIVLVEIFYDYHMILELPWLTMTLPNPITLHAYTFAPNAASEP